jgi:hypothetical protein
MCVTETPTFQEYWNDARFRRKRPNLFASLKLASGDNIYRWSKTKGTWCQLDSYHSDKSGAADPRHTAIDTRVNRVLVSTNFAYFGGYGPAIPRRFRNYAGEDICTGGRGRKVFDNERLVNEFTGWLASLGHKGYVAPPLDWGLAR